MGLEIERKFLLADDSWREAVTGSRNIKQGYLSRNPDCTVRLRIIDNTDAYITIKSRNRGDTRCEWEYPIDVKEAAEMFNRLPLQGKLEKTRHIVGRWEIDEFKGKLYPLLLAEIELMHSGEPIEIPPFIGEEVTSDPRYYNSVLAK